MIEFTEIEGKPEELKIKEMSEFYRLVFENTESDKFEERILDAEDLYTVLALHQGKIVGFKIGFRIAPKIFYSWLGGVAKHFRNLGIASKLMEKQHLWCRRNGFDLIRTKTKNEFKAMLILNIKHNFDIVNVYRNRQNELKIVLEKDLSKE